MGRYFNVPEHPSRQVSCSSNSPALTPRHKSLNFAAHFCYQASAPFSPLGRPNCAANAAFGANRHDNEDALHHGSEADLPLAAARKQRPPPRKHRPAAATRVSAAGSAAPTAASALPLPPTNNTTAAPAGAAPQRPTRSRLLFLDTLNGEELCAGTDKKKNSAGFWAGGAKAAQHSVQFEVPPLGTDGVPLSGDGAHGSGGGGGGNDADDSCINDGHHDVTRASSATALPTTAVLPTVGSSGDVAVAPKYSRMAASAATVAALAVEATMEVPGHEQHVKRAPPHRKNTKSFAASSSGNVILPVSSDGTVTTVVATPGTPAAVAAAEAGFGTSTPLRQPPSESPPSPSPTCIAAHVTAHADGAAPLAPADATLELHGSLRDHKTKTLIPLPQRSQQSGQPRHNASKPLLRSRGDGARAAAAKEKAGPSLRRKSRGGNGSEGRGSAGLNTGGASGEGIRGSADNVAALKMERRRCSCATTSSQALPREGNLVARKLEIDDAAADNGNCSCGNDRSIDASNDGVSASISGAAMARLAASAQVAQEQEQEQEQTDSTTKGGVGVMPEKELRREPPKGLKGLKESRRAEQQPRECKWPRPARALGLTSPASRPRPVPTQLLATSEPKPGNSSASMSSSSSSSSSSIAVPRRPVIPPPPPRRRLTPVMVVAETVSQTAAAEVSRNDAAESAPALGGAFTFGPIPPPRTEPAMPLAARALAPQSTTASGRPSIISPSRALGALATSSTAASTAASAAAAASAARISAALSRLRSISRSRTANATAGASISDAASAANVAAKKPGALVSAGAIKSSLAGLQISEQASYQSTGQAGADERSKADMDASPLLGLLLLQDAEEEDELVTSPVNRFTIPGSSTSRSSRQVHAGNLIVFGEGEGACGGGESEEATKAEALEVNKAAAAHQQLSPAVVRCRLQGAILRAQGARPRSPLGPPPPLYGPQGEPQGGTQDGQQGGIQGGPLQLPFEAGRPVIAVKPRARHSSRGTSGTNRAGIRF